MYRKVIQDLNDKESLPSDLLNSFLVLAYFIPLEIVPSHNKVSAFTATAHLCSVSCLETLSLEPLRVVLKIPVSGDVSSSIYNLCL